MASLGQILRNYLRIIRIRILPARIIHWIVCAPFLETKNTSGDRTSRVKCHVVRILDVPYRQDKPPDKRPDKSRDGQESAAQHLEGIPTG